MDQEQAIQDDFEVDYSPPDEESFDYEDGEEDAPDELEGAEGGQAATKPDPKISTAERILFGLILGFIDFAQILLVLVAVDDFWILDAVVSTIFFYFFLKGIPMTRQLVTWIGECIPYVGALPLNTIGWALTCWADSHPTSKLATAINTAGSGGRPSLRSVEERAASGVASSAAQKAGASKVGQSASSVASGPAQPGAQALPSDTSGGDDFESLASSQPKMLAVDEEVAQPLASNKALSQEEQEGGTFMKKLKEERSEEQRMRGFVDSDRNGGSETYDVSLSEDAGARKEGGADTVELDHAKNEVNLKKAAAAAKAPTGAEGF